MTRLVASAIAAAMIAGQQAEQPTTVLNNATLTVTRHHFAGFASDIVRTFPAPSVIVQINAGQMTVKERGVMRVGNRAGEVWFIPANTPHSIANGGRNGVDLLSIFIKPDRPTAPAAPPTQAPPGITRATLVDNDTIRVVRVRFEPIGREPVHTHPNDLLTVQITRGKVEIRNGSDHSTAEREPGFIQFLPRDVEHFFASADENAFELLSLSIK